MTIKATINPRIFTAMSDISSASRTIRVEMNRLESVHNDPAYVLDGEAVANAIGTAQRMLRVLAGHLTECGEDLMHRTDAGAMTRIDEIAESCERAADNVRRMACAAVETAKENPAPYGWLVNSDTNERIRPASHAECEESLKADPYGHIEAEGRTCYVEFA